LHDLPSRPFFCVQGHLSARQRSDKTLTHWNGCLARNDRRQTSVLTLHQTPSPWAIFVRRFWTSPRVHQISKFANNRIDGNGSLWALRVNKPGLTIADGSREIGAIAQE